MVISMRLLFNHGALADFPAVQVQNPGFATLRPFSQK
jgi:hypothetical protein